MSTVPAGTGLELRLSRSFTTTDVPITITPVAIDLAGNESPAPSLNYDPIAAIATPFVGPLPIAFIIRNNDNGQIVIDTPPFLPCNNTPQRPHNRD